MLRKLKQKVQYFIKSAVSLAQLKQNTKVQQVMIINQYVLMKKLLAPCEMPSFRDVGFKVHSQFEEDGILLYVFSVIGTTNKRVVEICAGDGMLSESISAAKMESSSAAFSETIVPQFLVSKVQVVNDICSNISD